MSILGFSEAKMKILGNKQTGVEELSLLCAFFVVFYCGTPLLLECANSFKGVDTFTCPVGNRQRITNVAAIVNLGFSEAIIKFLGFSE